MLRSQGTPSVELSRKDAEELRIKTRQALLAIGLLVAGSANTITWCPPPHPFCCAALALSLL